MSELGFQHTAGSSGQGLTFVRPLPHAGGIPAGEGDRSSVRQAAFGLVERLFPTRAVEDSGSLPPVTGVELGHFVIEERIGRGGMGAVFRALDKRLNRVVALKILSPEFSSDPEAVQRFQNEARAAARLDHDNIARVFYIGEEYGLHFIAFEFVMGTNVRNFIVQKGRLTPAEAVNYTLQIAEALRHTAAAGVVHRDIKPSNIIVSPTGRAKLVDLGLARNVNPDISRDLTLAGTALGTFDYIAPEQALDARNVDVRSDIYALGCTLYHMLTGAPPYPTGTMFEKVMKHHRADSPNPGEHNAHVSPQLSRVVQKMMASNPDERYASPESLIVDLVQIAEDLGLEPSPPESMIWTKPLFRRRSRGWESARTWTAVALTLLLLVVVDRLRLSVPHPPAADDTLGEAVTHVPQVAPLPASTAAPPQQNGDDTSAAPLAAVSPSQQLDSAELSTLSPRDSGTAGSQLSVAKMASAENSESVSKTSKPPAALEGPAPPPSALARPAAVPVAEALPEPFVVIGPGSEDRQYRSTLAAACALAQDNSVIEIHADGSTAVQQETLNITNKRIKVRPGRDHRPLLRFDFSAQRSLGSLSRIAEMIHVDRGSLELYDLDVEMVVDASSISDWALVTLINGSKLSAQGVSFTIANPGNSRAMLVYLPEDESGELGELMPDRMKSRQNVVDLKECLCRGQGDFAVQNSGDPLACSLQNTALAFSGYALRVDGSNTFAVVMEPDSSRLMTVLFDHVTAVTGKGIVQASSGDHGSLPMLDITVNDSVFRVDLPGQPFAEITGHEDYDLLRDKLKLRDGRDRSFFQVSGPLCVIDSTTSLLPGPARELTAEQLGMGTFDIRSEKLLVLAEPFDVSLLHRVSSAELALRPGDDNPAIGASSNLQDAGVDWRSPRLPVLRNAASKVDFEVN